MHESKRTLLFVGTALLTVALAAGTHWAMRPASLEQFSDVGEEFYPEFKDPNEATGLRVAAYNKDAARVDVFNVDFKDGLWRIPSHHNYPADGEERLANTATSIIGVKRDAVASTSADDFKRLGVLDPLDESVTGTAGRGDRITLLEGDNVLADYIIGTKVEGADNIYHIRRPDENRTYRAALDIDISTKFADWIEPGLLNITRGDLREIIIDGYSIDETRGVLVPGEVSRLTRDSSSASWELNDLPENETVKTSEVDAVISGLEDLKIVGVRPKPVGLSSDLKGEGATKLDTLAFIDLQSKGYFVDADGGLVSNEGEVRVGTAEGALYVLRFGEVFTGSDVEIEVGKPSEEASEEESSESEAASDDEPESADESESDKTGEESQKQSRYLFITTQFDKSLIPGPGEKPVKPEKPQPKAEEEPATDEDQSEDKAEGDAGDTEDSSADEKAESEDTKESAEDAPEDAAYEKALAEYETKLKTWEADQKAHEEKLEKGRERVSELNTRFADWYYVISAESFDEIRVARADFIEAKEPGEAATANENTPPAAPELPAASEPKETDKAAPESSVTPESTESPEKNDSPEKSESSETSDSPETNSPPSDDSKPDKSESDTPPPGDESTLPEGEPDSAPPPADASDEETPQAD